MCTSQKYNLIMLSTTLDNLFWAEFESTVTQIALNNAEYWKTMHCDKIPMRTSPWRGSHKTNNLLRYNHSRRYQDQLLYVCPSKHSANKNNLQFVWPFHFEWGYRDIFRFESSFRARHFINNKLFNQEGGIRINWQRRYRDEIIKLVRLKDWDLTD